MKLFMVSLLAIGLWSTELMAQAESIPEDVQLAQRRSRPQRRSQPQRVSPQNQRHQRQSRVRSRRTRAFPKLGGSFRYWNERIQGTRGTASSHIEMQFTGFGVHQSYNQYFSRSRWRRVYTGEIAGGFVKGKGTSGLIGDGLKDQPWLALTLAPGVIRRISAESEIGFGAPLSYRFIFWKLKDGNFEMDRGGSFSVGGELYLLNNLSPRSTLRVAISQHYMWETTLFSVGWEWRPNSFLWSRFF